jgi:hypothetical protein
MKICISGASERIDKKNVRSVLKWLEKELRLDRFKTPISVKVKFIKNLYKNTGCYGQIIWEDTNYRPRKFSIDIDPKSYVSKITKTLIHEMIHVSQFASGKMQDSLRVFNQRRWSTKWNKKFIDMDKVDYDDHPWEIEAYALEPIYYEKWKVYKRKNR